MTATVRPTGADHVGLRLLDQARRTPDAPFLVFDGAGDRLSFTYREAVRLGWHGHDVLRSAGVGPGERFAIATANRWQFFACWFGAAFAGSTMVPISPKSSSDELSYVLRHAECRSVVLDDESASLAEAAPGLSVLHCDRDFELTAESTSSSIEITDAPLSIMYTSGTTSRPKGVMVTHANYVFAGEAVAQHLRIRDDDRWLVALPMFHANAQFYSVMSSLVSGASVAVAERFSASRWSSQVREHGATLASLFAAPIRMILSRPGASDDRDNRLRATVFAQNVTSAELTQFEERFDVPLLQLYGMTETIAPPVVNPLYGARDNLTIGRPRLGTEIRVVSEAGIDVAPGEVGQLLVHGRPGRTLMAGYLNNPEATGKAVVDEWLHTGDLVTLRADGFLAFYDRAGDVIKRAGENIAAAEIERVVDEHPEVLESAAIGVPDSMRDEAVKVIVVRRNGTELDAESVLDHCREHLATYKVPSYVEFAATLPRTSVGKIRKSVLR